MRPPLRSARSARVLVGTHTHHAARCCSSQVNLQGKAPLPAVLDSALDFTHLRIAHEDKHGIVWRLYPSLMQGLTLSEVAKLAHLASMQSPHAFRDHLYTTWSLSQTVRHLEMANITLEYGVVEDIEDFVRTPGNGDQDCWDSQADDILPVLRGLQESLLSQHSSQEDEGEGDEEDEGESSSQ